MLPWADTLYGQVKNGVLTLSGYSISVREQNGCLEIIDGLKGRSEVKLRYSRASCPVSRLIVVRSEGIVTLRAVRWLRDVGASLIVLDYDGSPILVSCPKANVPAGLRRKQALLTAETPLGASIVRNLIAAKIAGQIEVLKRFMHAAAIDASAYAARINTDMSVLDLLGIEGRVSATYWQALADRPLHFGRRQDVPEHWQTFGSRRSPLTGTPRRAVRPGPALLNYLYSVAASEITISLHSIGLLPELDCGLHEDKDNRMSLSYSLIEPARPVIDEWFFGWLSNTTFSKRDFAEDRTGAITITHPLNSHVAMTSSLWRGIADQLAQWFYLRLTRPRTSTETIRLKFVSTDNEAKRRAVQWMPGNSIQRPIPSTCMECGKTLRNRQRKFCSDDCMTVYHGGRPFDAGLTAIARARAKRAQSDDALASRITSEARPLTLDEWQQQAGWSRERDREMQKWYLSEVLPHLMAVRPMTIGKVLSVGTTYSIAIRFGRKTPSPRHYRALALLAGVAYPW